MINATLVHVEIGIEYYEGGNLIFPSADKKLMWSLYGLPNNIKRFEKSFETEIDKFTCFSKQEVQVRVNENIKNNTYNFLPTNANIELRF